MSRILLSAYACEPGKGSEPEVGWLWATELADAGHEVWVITREANRHAIEMELAQPATDHDCILPTTTCRSGRGDGSAGHAGSICITRYGSGARIARPSG